METVHVEHDARVKNEPLDDVAQKEAHHEAALTKTSLLEQLKERFNPLRWAGFSAYLAWMLATFYNTFLLVGAQDMRQTLYVNMLVSLGVLAITLVSVPLIFRRADKQVLSKRVVILCGSVMVISTAILPLADTSTLFGFVITLLSAIFTGASSGVLFLGWCRLYADVGPRPAMFEMALASVAAAVMNIVLSVMHPIVALIFTLLLAAVSAVLLRMSAFIRPERPQPKRDHKLKRRTRLMFIRGLVACGILGLVAGFLDVLAGFNYVPVPDHYETYLAVSLAVVSSVIALMALSRTTSFMTDARRIVFVLLMLGCLLTIFLVQIPGLSEVVYWGAYEGGFVIMLCGICIDVSNYFDQRATKTFGFSFFALYLGELLGSLLCVVLTEVLGVTVASLPVMAFVICAVTLITTSFLFTEEDLIETGIGEMTDEDEEEVLFLPGEIIDDTVIAAGNGNLTEPNYDEVTVSGSAASVADPLEKIAAELAEEYGLTARESEVLPLILRGRTLARMQEELHISQGTASTHTRHIYQKLGVHNRQALLDMVDTRLSQKQ